MAKTIYDNVDGSGRILCLGIDLETLDTRTSAKVLSIGAVLYEIPVVYNCSFVYEELESFYVNIDPASYSEDFTTSKSTMEWWFTQPEAFKILGQNRISYQKALDQLYDFYHSGDAEGRTPSLIVGKPSHFDISIIENCFNHHLKTPWSHRDVFCLRTLYSQMAFDQSKIDFKGIEHYALDDARWQARGHVAAHLEFLQMKEDSR